MATIYLERDNTITLALTQDGSPPAQNVITRAALWIPGSAFTDGNPRVLDSAPAVSLIDNATKVSLALGDTDIKTGTHYCYLTIFDAVNTDGIAWDTLILKVNEWPATV